MMGCTLMGVTLMGMMASFPHVRERVTHWKRSLTMAGRWSMRQVNRGDGD